VYRSSSFEVVVLSALAIGLAAAQGLDDGQAPAPSARAGTAGSGVYPSLRTVSDLGLPGGRTTDAGVGVYPALSDPETLTFPGPGAVEAARSYAATREGRISFAVADARGGIAGQAFDERYASASLVKTMILVAYLDRAERDGAGLSEADIEQLDAMIRVSDNDSATSIFRRLGPAALTELARRSGMRSFSVGTAWANAQVTAADQARFFLVIDRLLPAARRRDYARYLLSHVAPYQSWGIPQAARPSWQVYFKGGWRPDGAGEIVHQAALLEQGPRRFAIAVLTDGNPTEIYGQETIRGVAQRLLAPAARRTTPASAIPGRLAPVTTLRDYHAPEPRPLRPLPAAPPSGSGV
jgi:beta-lactamase class A